MEPEGLPETGWISNKGKWIKSVVNAYTPSLVKVVAFKVEEWFGGSNPWGGWWGGNNWSGNWYDDQGGDGWYNDRGQPENGN